MAIETGVVPFKGFLDSVRQTDPDSFASSEKTVSNAEAVRQMRTHILDRYKGAEAKCSFIDANGSVVDCISLERQPILRGTREAVAQATALRNGEPTCETESRTDCPGGTIPVRRVTLEEMSKFEDLEMFFKENLLEHESRRPPEVTPSGIGTHRWEYAFQSVANIASSICGLSPSSQRWSS
jgi:hypothetical protein